MIAKNFVIVDSHGLHAIPAQMLAKLAKDAQFPVYAEDPETGRFSADNVIMLLSLQIPPGEHLRIIVDTTDAGEAEVFFEEVENLLLPKNPC